MFTDGIEIDEPFIKTELFWLPGPAGATSTPVPKVPKEIKSNGLGDWLPNGQVLLQTRDMQLGANEASAMVVNRQ